MANKKQSLFPRAWRAESLAKVLNTGIPQTKQTIINAYDDVSKPVRGKSNKREAKMYVNLALALLDALGLLTVAPAGKLQLAVHQVQPAQQAPPRPVTINFMDAFGSVLIPPGSDVTIGVDASTGKVYVSPMGWYHPDHEPTD